MIGEHPLPPTMTFFRLGILAAATSLSSCTLPTAPEPPEFKLSDKALRQQYHAKLKSDDFRLYADEIQTTRDESGSESHVASGGALLVKDSIPPILAMAPSISITPEATEVPGKSIVKKNDRLYMGQNESTKFRIVGTAISLRGDYLVRGIAPEALEEVEASPPPPQEQAKVKRKTVSKPKASPSPPKTEPAVDRNHLLKLLREPTDR